MDKVIFAIPEYAYNATGKNIDMFYNYASGGFTEDIPADNIMLSKNDLRDTLALNAYVQSLFKKDPAYIADSGQEKVFIDLKDFSIQMLQQKYQESQTFDMSSMKNLTPWIFESRGNVLFVILQDIFVGYMVKGDDSTLVKFIIHVLTEYKKYYGEESLLSSSYFKRFIGLVM